MHSDPIADLLTRIRNGYRAGLATVECTHTKIKEEIVRILKEEGLIADFEYVKKGKFPSLRVHLRYDADRRPILREIRRISMPGLRVYKPSAELTPVRSGMATQIVSTNIGLMTDREARRRRVGGEVICEVW
ncbi:MAG: 30S ribosomal protein S8 [Armatimonadetes bacterium]|nr:30S ribosomal protein S8 [Armatimonadota bacterium]